MGFLRLAHRYLIRQTMPAIASGYYDRMIESVAGFYLSPFCEEVWGAFPGPAKIVDAGTGTGVLPVMLARGNPGYRITGLDLSEGCLRAGRERAQSEGCADRVRLTRADLERCPLDSGSADLVVSTCSLHHWRRPVAVLRELARLTADTGEIWILDHSAAATREDRRRWVARVESAAHSGPLFRIVYPFESRFLSYSRAELEEMCERAGLRVADFDITGVFLFAKIERQRP